MKKRDIWLQAAVRAQQAQTLEHMQRAQQARDELAAAEQLARRSGQSLHSLNESWARQRRDVSSAAAPDEVYRLFHGFLQGQSSTANEARKARQVQVDAVVADLQQSHAVQQTLERLAEQALERRRREARDKETRDAAQAWLLGCFISENKS